MCADMYRPGEPHPMSRNTNEFYQDFQRMFSGDDGVGHWFRKFNTVEEAEQDYCYYLLLGVRD